MVSTPWRHTTTWAGELQPSDKTSQLTDCSQLRENSTGEPNRSWLPETWTWRSSDPSITHWGLHYITLHLVLTQWWSSKIKPTVLNIWISTRATSSVSTPSTFHCIERLLTGSHEQAWTSEFKTVCIIHCLTNSDVFSVIVQKIIAAKRNELGKFTKARQYFHSTQILYLILNYI